MGDNPIESVTTAATTAATAVGMSAAGPLGAGAGYVGGKFLGKKAEKMLAPDLPKPGQSPAVASPDDPEVQDAMGKAAAGQRRARGRASTILTSGSGASGQITTARRTLLGV